MDPTQASLFEPTVIEADAMLHEVRRHPAPWTLRADCYVVAVRLPDDVLDTAVFAPKALITRRRSRTAVLMYLDYKQAPCGPYQELLVAPATYMTDAGTYPSITRIFVSSYESVVNGRKNWGIPKDLAQFTRDTDDGRDNIQVTRDGQFCAELKLRGYGPLVPVRSWLLPAAIRTLVQHWNGRRYSVTLRAGGRARLAKVEDWRFNSTYFPDLARGRVLTASHVPELEMVFPEAQVQNY